MRFYMFKSDTTGGLHAFAGDPSGSNLPQQFGPWYVTGVVAADKEPPHGLSRSEIEKALDTNGFQLWRMKSKPIKN